MILQNVYILQVKKKMYRVTNIYHTIIESKKVFL